MTGENSSMRDLLNDGTPYAPQTRAEVLARLQKADARSTTSRDEEPPPLSDPVIARPSPGAPEPAAVPGNPGREHEQRSAEIRQNLQQVREIARRHLEELKSRRTTGSDQDGDVEAVVNGAGELVELRINESATRRAHRLGSSISAAVASARGKATELNSAWEDDHLPTESDYAEIAELLTTPPERVDFGWLDATESIESRDVIAQALETRQRIAEIAGDVTQSQSVQEVGLGAGQITLSEGTGVLEVDIPRQALRELGRERMAQHVLHAIRQVEQEAAQRRTAAFDSIRIDGITLGSHLRRLRRTISDLD